MSKGWYPVIDYDKCIGCADTEYISQMMRMESRRLCMEQAAFMDVMDARENVP